MTPLWTILGLWRTRADWLLAGLVVALLALLAGIGLMALSGFMLVGGAVLAAPALRGLGVARVVLRYAERLITHAATFRALADLRVWFFRGLARGAGGGLGFRRAGDMLSRLVNDVEALDGLYLRILLPLAAALLLGPLLGLLLGLLIAPVSWVLACVVVAIFFVAALLVPWIAARGSLAAGGRLSEAGSALRVAALDALGGRREVRAFGAEGRMLALVQGREATLLAAQHALAARSAWAGAGAFLCGQAAILAALLAGIGGDGSVVVAVFLVLAAFEATGGLPRAGVLAGHAAAAAGRVLEAACKAPAVPEPITPSGQPVGFGLRFDGVHFGWLAGGPALFNGLSLEVPEGARVALLGPSGAGKSSLAALALRQMAPWQGTVRLGGVDLANLPAASVQARIGWLAQATHLFDDTIRNNLLLARPDAEEPALWAALEAARIAEMVRGLPDGLDTWVGEGGARFSGGQGRRLALARTLLSPARILILDEPCAGLDAATEREFLQILNEAVSGRSVILIAHRLTGVERLDRIYRLSGGRAVAAAG